MKLRLLGPRYWPTWLAMLVLFVIAWLPFRLQLFLGRACGRLLRHLPLRSRRVAAINIDLCLPALDPAQRRRLLREHFENLGIALCETAVAWWRSDSTITARSTLEGGQHLRAAAARGQGAIVLAAHFTTLEIGARILASHLPIHVVYRPSRNALLNAFLQWRRGSQTLGAIKRDDIRSVIRALKQGKPVWYAPDQSFRWKGAAMVPLFGVPAPTNLATSRLAAMTGAAVLPYFVERLPGAGGYRAVIHAPLQDFPCDDPLHDARRMHELIESEVRRMPAQYLWVHRRFKQLDATAPDRYAV
ncbi:MAG: LpxL/LpxP family Kdo(2)-lipid IV(A) lauroyl/palmitoleoyl acyltransferase [Steroidobacteraceae bacterium]